MIACNPDDPSLQQFIVELGAIAPRPHHSGVLAAADRLVPGCEFRHVLTRGGWYRLGGVIRPDGTRLADDLESWAEAEVDACDGEIEVLLERHAKDGLLATRLSGRTHYFVAPLGPKAADFVQVEIEELQELLDRRLFDPDHLATDLPELTDPLLPLKVEPQAVSRPWYRFRRMTDMRQVAARQHAPLGGVPPLARFMAEWDYSNRGARGHFCKHWIVGVREHQDRYRNSVLSAAPISLQGRKLKSFQWLPDTRGAELSQQVLDFDRAAGYPSAWYFHMVAGALVPRDVAFAIARDLAAGFRYLPEADIALLEQWLDSPYAV